MENGELVFPSFIAPAPDSHTIIRALAYMPSLNCCVFFVNDFALPLQVLNLNSRSVVQRLAVEAVEDVQDCSDVIALSPNGMLLASGVQSDNDLCTQVRLSLLAIESIFSECVSPVQSCFIAPDFCHETITCMRFFPDGKKIVVTIFRRREFRRGMWLRMYDVADNIWSKEQEMGEVKSLESVACVEGESQDKREENNRVQNISEQTDCRDSLGSDNKEEPEEIKLENNINKDNDSFCVSDSKEDVEREGGTNTHDLEINAEHDTYSDSSDKIAEKDDNENIPGNSESDESDAEIAKTRDEVLFECYELNVIDQGYSIPPSPPESSLDSDREFHTVEEYYDWRYSSDLRTFDESNLFRFPSGFYCLAISPDTTRLLTGNHDGEVFITDEYSFRVLQHIQAHEKDTVVRCCHYNPVFGHDEFATCGGDLQLGVVCNKLVDSNGSMCKIWRVKQSENGDESASCVHALSLTSRPANCCYSPDGKLVAVTCDNMFTYIVCARSGVIMFTLTYVSERSKPRPSIDEMHFSSTVFAGRTCQVITTPNHDNFSIAIWDLPVVYSLETSCLLVIRATMKYSDIDTLHLPTSLKLRIKYLYV